MTQTLAKLRACWHKLLRAVIEKSISAYADLFEYNWHKEESREMEKLSIRKVER